MTRLSSRLSLLLVWTALTLLAVPVSAAKGPLHVSPWNPRQGDALFVRLTTPGVEKASVSWLNKTYPLYPSGAEWRGAVPIRPETAPGGRTLTVKFTRGGRQEQVQKSVEVARAKFPVQHLKMARSTARLYNYPGVEKENKLVGDATHAKSDDRLWSGNWLLPAKGRISTYYGERRIRNGRQVGRHRGLDIAAKKGSPVVAAADGRVVLAGSYRKHGKTVVLDHGQGITSLYLHMNDLHVQTGDVVSRGEQLGTVGSTGVSTGPHLHWSVYVHGTSLDPFLFCRLSKRGVTI